MTRGGSHRSSHFLSFFFSSRQFERRRKNEIKSKTHRHVVGREIIERKRIKRVGGVALWASS